jgi:pimeloyl-ACP methyl ester carboxylesterase
MHLLYLHGFASSARSSKAGYFRARAAERGVDLLTPDFNEPSFEGLTITRMVGQVSDVMAGLPPGPVSVIGSSLGAFVAVQVALQHRRVDRLVLLAPALDFSGNRLRDLGDRGLEEWRRTDTLNVFHYGFGRMMPVRFGLYEDAARYNALDAELAIPIQIFQGTRDVAVSP